MNRWIVFGLLLNAALLVLVAQQFLSVAGAIPTPVATQNGDLNGDGSRDISDAVYLLNFLFQGGSAPVACAGGAEAPTVEEVAAFLLANHANELRGPAGQPGPTGPQGPAGECCDEPPAPEPAVTFDSWRVVHNCEGEDSVLRRLFDQFASGAVPFDPSSRGSLSYFNSSGGEIRRIDFFGVLPRTYEDRVTVGGLTVEILTFYVQRCEYSIGAATGSGLSYLFRFEILGNELSETISVEPGAMHVVYAEQEPRAAAVDDGRLVAGDEPVDGAGAGRLPPECQIFGFDFEADGQDWGAWREFSGLSRSLEATAEGRVVAERVTPLVLTGPLRGQSERELLFRTLAGLDPRRFRPIEATLDLFGQTGDIEQRLALVDCALIRYEPPAVDARASSAIEDRISLHVTAVR